MLQIVLRQKPLAFPLDDTCELLASACARKSWSGRDLRSWVERAERRAVQRAIQNGGPEHFQITQDDFLELDNSTRCQYVDRFKSGHLHTSETLQE